MTARGNLPRRVVAAALAALEEAGVEPEWRPGPRRNESDFPELHLARLLVELSALGRKYRGRLQLVRATQPTLERGDWGAIYRELLRSHTREFNWAYQDGYPPLPTIQHGALFSLYLLARYGDQWRPASFYTDAFVRAFPMVLEEAEEQRGPRDAREVLETIWPLRTFQRFARPFGLIEMRDDPDEPGPFPLFRGNLQVRKSPFYDQVLTWQGAG